MAFWGLCPFYTHSNSHVYKKPFSYTYRYLYWCLNRVKNPYLD